MDTRTKIIDTVDQVLAEFSYPALTIDSNILPNEDDKSTLFICSGMQRVRNRFWHNKVDKHSSIQKCIRLQDIDLVGDDSHISSFEMIGTFGFNTNDYVQHIYIWCEILDRLGIRQKVTHITIHPEMEPDYTDIWKSLGFKVIKDESCVWSDGETGGYCCEVFINDLEIGNLVNPQGRSCDIGFGLERLVQVIEDKPINETSLFDNTLPALSRDHIRTLRALRENNISPGAKNVSSVCKRLIRNLIKNGEYLDEFANWIEEQQALLDKKYEFISKNFAKWDTKPKEYWFDTHGISEEDLELWKQKQKNESE